MAEVVIQLAAHRDIPRMVEVFRRAYEVEEDFSSMAASFDVNLEIQPDGCFLALLCGRAVGIACYTIYDGLAWVGLVGVVPELQRRGIGTRLMREVLNKLRGAGVTTIRLDASKAGHGLYRRLGFVDEYKTITYDIGDARLPTNVEGVEVSHDIPEYVVELDRAVFGIDRLRIIKAWVKRSAKILTVEDKGYCMLWNTKLGPLIAKDSDTALMLLVKARELGATSIIVPEANPQAMKLMNEIGGKITITCTRMRLGSKHVEDIKKIFGILNYAKG